MSIITPPDWIQRAFCAFDVAMRGGFSTVSHRRSHLVLATLFAVVGVTSSRAAVHTRLVPLPAPRIVTGLKPSDDGRAIIVRLWNAGEREVQASLRWTSPAPRRVRVSDTNEQPQDEGGSAVEIPASDVLTLRAELP